MSERKSLLYFLFSKNNVPYYKDQYGRILEADGNWKKPDGNPAHLIKDPIGTKDSTWKYARNPATWGVFRDFTAPYKFPDDGRDILRYLLWTFGREVKCRIGILKLDRANLPYQYKNIYLSEINFAKYSEQKEVAEVEALEGGPSKYWKARSSEKYTIPVDGNANHVRLYNDGMEINNTATLAVLNGNNPLTEWRNHLVNVEVVQREVKVGGVYSVPRTQVSNDNAAIKATKQFLMEATADQLVPVQWDFTLRVEYDPPAPALNPGASIACVLRVVPPSGIVSQQVVLFTAANGAFPIINKTYHVVGNGGVNLKAGDQLFLFTYCNIQGAGGDAQMHFIYGGNNPFIKFTYTYRHPPTYISCLTALELGKQLVKEMSNGECDLVSDFLSKSDILYAAADSIRGLLDTKIVITWKEFYQSLQQFGVMMFFEGNNFRIEAFSWAFQSGTSIDIGQVRDAKVYFAEDLTFNKIKVGPPKQNYEEINGRYEFNQPQQWGLPILTTEKELDLTTPVRTDAIGAEVLRINFEGKLTTDSESDNDTFMFAAKRTANTDNYIAEERIIFNDLTGNYDVPFATSRTGANFKADDTFTKFTYNATIPQQVRITTDIQIVKDDRTNTRVTIFRNTDILIENIFVANGNMRTVDTGNFIINPGDVIRINVTQVNGSVSSLFLYAKMTVNFTATFIYNLLRPAYTSVTGIGAPTSVYNTTLRPKQSILNNAALIHSVAETYLDNQNIKFNSADKNVDLTTVLNGVTMKESEPVPINSLSPIAFKPWYIKFATEINVDLFTIIKMNQYQRISFEWNGSTHYAFLWDGSVKVATEDAQEWIVLAAPETDLKKFNQL